MKEEDTLFIVNILDNSPLLFYGEFEGYLDTFLKEVFARDFKECGFGEVEMTNDFATAYWFFLSWMVSQDLFEYGTSPRGGWLTEKGDKFKKIVTENENAIQSAQDFIYKQNH